MDTNPPPDAPPANEPCPSLPVPQPRRWFHGSPLRLDRRPAGSTLTPIVELAKAFAHKPPRVDIRTEDRAGRRFVTIEHTGQLDGFLYEVLVADPAADLRQHPTSGFAPGEEMLATRDLPLRPIEPLPAAGSSPIHFDGPLD